MMYLLGDGVDVAAQVLPELLLRGGALELVRVGGEHAVVVFQRELRIDRDLARSAAGSFSTQSAREPLESVACIS